MEEGQGKMETDDPLWRPLMEAAERRRRLCEELRVQKPIFGKKVLKTYS